MLRLYTFGGLRIECAGQSLQLPTQRARDLLAYLISFRSRHHPRLTLVGVLWPDLPEDKARRRLSDTLWRLRRVLEGCVASDDEFVWFNTDLPCWLDVEQFERAAATIRSADLPAIEEALALYQGPFLDGLYHDWALLERERLRGLYLDLLWRVLDLHKQASDYAAALQITQRLVAAEPLHEAAHREQMRLHHLLGRDAEALAQYQRCREVLRRELGVDPAPETEALYHVLSRRVAGPPAAVEVHLPVPAHRVAPDLGEPPLVGRDGVRAALLGRLEAAASGRGGVILLEGEPGVGKSRLAQEVVAGARWRNLAVTVAHAEESALSSYALLVEALSPLLTPLRLRQLARLIGPEYLQAVASLLPAVRQVLPDLEQLPDLPPPQARGRLQQALSALILGLSRITPHLWVLEDLQWADPETLSLLPHLLPQLGASRSLFVLTGRSAELRATPDVWDALQAIDRAGVLERHHVAPLDVDAVGRLLHVLMDGGDAALATHLMRESGGVPLYLVETLKAWRDEGYLEPTGRGRWQWHERVPAAPPSHAGAAVISHRLSRLSPAAAELLAAAAVIGTEADFDLLVAVCGLPALGSDRALDGDYLVASDELLRLELLVETDVGYRFSHERVRQAVYRQLSDAQRQGYHRGVAAALQSLSPQELELLAHHHAAAGEWEAAVDCLTRAARRARDLFAHQAALGCYRRLLDLLARPRDRLARYDVLRDRAEVLGWIGDREAQGRDLEEMLRLAESLADDGRLAAALRRRSEWNRMQGRYAAANEDALAAIDIYRRQGNDRNRASLLCQLGWNVVYTADHPQAAGYFREGLSIYQSLSDLVGQINCLSGLTASAELAGDYAAALSHLRDNMALAEATGDSVRIARALHNTGTVHYDLGDMETAAAYFRQALQLKETSGDLRSQAITHFYLGAVATEQGELERAEARLVTALRIFRQVQDASWEGDALAALGRLALLQGDDAVAKGHLGAAYRRRMELGEPAYAVIDLSYLALAELSLGDESSAWQHSREALAELERGLTGVEHPQQIYHNHFRVAEGTRHWAAARAALEAAAAVVDERAGRIDDPSLRQMYRSGRRVNRAIAEALAAQPPPGRLRVRLARADVPAHRRPLPSETVVVTWSVDAGAADAAPARAQGKVAQRRACLLRLLAEAAAAGALPTVADLAGALEVSPRTIRADVAALRRQGHCVETRGRRA
jgi:predicted ATPase/DNA-binding SARP family transcriptional activator